MGPKRGTTLQPWRREKTPARDAAACRGYSKPASLARVAATLVALERSSAIDSSIGTRSSNDPRSRFANDGRRTTNRIAITAVPRLAAGEERPSTMPRDDHRCPWR